jgi:hypothetical protein
MFQEEFLGSDAKAGDTKRICRKPVSWLRCHVLCFGIDNLNGLLPLRIVNLILNWLRKDLSGVNRSLDTANTYFSNRMQKLHKNVRESRLEPQSMSLFKRFSERRHKLGAFQERFIWPNLYSWLWGLKRKTTESQETLRWICLNPLTRFSYLASMSFGTCPEAIGASSAKNRSVTLVNLHLRFNHLSGTGQGRRTECSQDDPTVQWTIPHCNDD